MPSLDLDKRLVIGGAWALMGRSSSIFLGFATTALLTRLLSPQEIGTYFLIISLVTIAALVAQLGLGQTAVRMIAAAIGVGAPGRAFAAAVSILAYGAAGVLVTTIVLGAGLADWIAGALFNAPLMRGMSVPIALLVAGTTMIALLAEVFRGFHDIRNASLIGSVWAALLALLALIGLWWMSRPVSLSLVIDIHVLAAVTVVALAVWRALPRIGSLRREERPKLMRYRELLSVAWPIWIYSISYLLLRQVDIWVIGYHLAKDEVAVYAAAARLSLLVEFPLVMINAVTPPLIAQLHAAGEKDSLQHRLRTLATIGAVPTLLIAAAFWYYGGVFLGTIYGPYYATGYSILGILSLGHVANMLTGSCGFALMMTGHQRTLMATSLVSATVAIAGTLLIIKPYGAVGVAWVVTSVVAGQNIAMLLFARFRLGIWTHANWPLGQRRFS